MTASSMKIIYETHVVRIDIELKDTRRHGYRTAIGRIKPYFTFVLFPGASIVMDSILKAKEPDQETLAALLFAALSKSSDRPYGGKPDEIWLNESTTIFAPRLRRLQDNLGITIKSNKIGQLHAGEVERLLETLKQRFRAQSIHIGLQVSLTKAPTEISFSKVSIMSIVGIGRKISLLFPQGRRCLFIPLHPSLHRRPLKFFTTEGGFVRHRLVGAKHQAAITLSGR